MFFVALDNLTQEEPGINKTGDTVAIDQVVFDPLTNTVYAKPFAALDQHRRYALVSPMRYSIAAGAPVAPIRPFKPARRAARRTAARSQAALGRDRILGGAAEDRGRVGLHHHERHGLAGACARHPALCARRW